MNQKNSYNNKKHLLLEISKRKVFVGVFVGVFFSIIFYTFLKLISKIYIVFDALFHDYELITFSEKVTDYYSFLFAFIAVYFSFSVVFNFIIETPKKFLSKYNYKRNAVLNQQRVTNWFFLSWFSRIGMLIGLLALDMSSSGFLSDNSFIVILFIITFIGQMWISINRFLSKNKFKWFLVTVFTSLLLAFLISKIEVIDNNAINKSILSKNILYKHNIKRVISENFQHLPEHRSLYFNIYLKENNNHLLIKTDNSFFARNKSLKDKITFFKSRISEAEEAFIIYILYVDKDVKMKHILKLKKNLKEEGANNIFYSVVKKEQPFYKKTNKAFGFYLNLRKQKVIDIETMKIKFLADKLFLFQGKRLSKVDLKKAIKERIKEYGLSPFVLSFKNETKFEEYFAVLSLTREVIDEFRNNMALKGYNQEYNSLSRSLKKPIKEKYYWAFVDDVK